MKKLFAMAIDNSFIVSGDTKEELNGKIEEIKQQYPDYFKRFVKPGIYIVQAKSLKEAKFGKKHKSQLQSFAVL